MRTTAGVIVALALVATASGCSDGSSSPVASSSSPSASAGYQQQVEAVIQDWGSIAVQGMRPAIADLAHPGGVPRAGIATEAKAWTAALSQDRDRLQHVVAPSSYEPTRQLLIRSLNGYLRAAAIVRSAAQQPDAGRRRAALERAARVLTAADQTFDRARSGSN